MAGKKKTAKSAAKKAAKPSGARKATRDASAGEANNVPLALSSHTLAALTATTAAAPVIPPKSMRAEARTLLKAIERDRKDLELRGLRELDVTLLREVMNKLENIEQTIIAARGEGRTAMEERAEKDGIALRTNILECLEFALLTNPETEEAKAAAERIARIREDEGIDDLIDDLRACVPFLNESKKKLAAVGVEAAPLVSQAKSIAETLSELVTTRRLQKVSKALYEERDGAATLLWDTLNKIRRIGRFAMRDRPKFARDYGSTYNRQRRAVSKAKKTRESKKAPKGPTPEQ